MVAGGDCALSHIDHRRDADAAADEQQVARLIGKAEALPQRSVHAHRVPTRAPRKPVRPAPDDVVEQREAVAVHPVVAEGPREQRVRAFEAAVGHHELARLDAPRQAGGVKPAEEPARVDLFGGEHGRVFDDHPPTYSRNVATL